MQEEVNQKLFSRGIQKVISTYPPSVKMESKKQSTLRSSQTSIAVEEAEEKLKCVEKRLEHLSEMTVMLQNQV
jgi:ribosomal protein L31E